MCKLESYQVAKLVRCRINLKDAELHNAYYPAHFSVALIDAIFNPQLRYEKQVVPIIKRYCRYLRLTPPVYAAPYSWAKRRLGKKGDTIYVQV